MRISPTLEGTIYHRHQQRNPDGTRKWTARWLAQEYGVSRNTIKRIIAKKHEENKSAK